MKNLFFIAALLLAGIIQAQNSFESIEWENNLFFDKESKMYQEASWNVVSVAKNDSIDWVLVMRVINNELGKMEFLPYNYLTLGSEYKSDMNIYCDGTFVAAGFDKKGVQCTEFKYFMSSYYFCDSTGGGEIELALTLK